MNLKDKARDDDDIINGKFNYDDVKEAVLEFQKRLKIMKKQPNEIERYELLSEFIEIFGDFEK